VSAAARIVVTGLGTVNAVARDAEGFAAALRAGACGMATVPPAPGEPGGPRVMAPVAGFSWQDDLQCHRERLPDCVARARKILRNNSGSARLSAAAAFQAIDGSGLLPAASGSERVGIVVAGSNLQQRDVWDNLRRQAEGRAVNPRYGLSFLDSGQVGCLGEIFGLRGLGYSVGAASASGTMALFQAWHWLRAGLLDGCLVVGANSDLSPLELEGFELLGALGGRGWEDRPEQACRPFDRRHAGFLWGQGSGALLLERHEAATARGAPLRGELLGAAVAMDGNHLPDQRHQGTRRPLPERGRGRRDGRQPAAARGRLPASQPQSGRADRRGAWLRRRRGGAGLAAHRAQERLRLRRLQLQPRPRPHRVLRPPAGAVSRSAPPP
jgi:malonyl-ACP decarboxylase